MPTPNDAGNSGNPESAGPPGTGPANASRGPKGGRASPGQQSRRARQGSAKQGSGSQGTGGQGTGSQGSGRQGQTRQGQTRQGSAKQGSGRQSSGRQSSGSARQGSSNDRSRDRSGPGGVEAATRPARSRDLSAPPQAVQTLTRQVNSSDASAKPARGRPVAIAGIPALVVFVIVIAVAAALNSVVVGLLVAVVLCAAIWAAVWFGAERVLVGRLGGGFVEDADVPRAANLVDGLCATMGLPLPALYLVDDPFRGALVLGRSESTATLVVTTGLLRALDPVELEGVLAHELSHVKFGDMATGTMAAAVVLPLAPVMSSSPELVRKLAGSGRELAADVRASAVTRYPPGLRDALVKMAAGPSPAAPSVLAGSGVGRVLRWLWTVVPELLAPRSSVGVLDASTTRIAALDEA